MPETPSKPRRLPHLLVHLTGFTLALTCALWAGAKFTLTGSSLAYGALTGLSFGALFAFGQRIRQNLFPGVQPSRWKSRTPAPEAPALRPAQRAAMQVQPLTVKFDDSTIQTLRGESEQETLAWQDIDRIVITIGDSLLPMPLWLLTTSRGGIRLPNDTPGLEALTEQFKTRLPGYADDRTYQAIIEAMGAMEGSFDIWHRNAAAAAATD